MSIELHDGSSTQTPSITITKRIVKCGNSLMVPISDICNIIGAGRGDAVEVTIHKI